MGNGSYIRLFKKPCKIVVKNYVNLLYIKFYLYVLIIEGDEKMIYPSIDRLLNIVDSKYELVHIVADRAKVMKIHHHYQMPENQYKSKKEIGRALEEIEKGLITVKNAE